MKIRTEQAGDAAAIRSLITSAFQDAPHSGGNEADIVDVLRSEGALSVSLLADHENSVVGHVALSPVYVDGRSTGWFGLGPVAVLIGWQRRGIGAALIKAGLERIQDIGAHGCVVLGDPTYYRRFGFETDPDLRYANVPAEYFQRLLIKGKPPQGTVTYHSAFSAS